MASQYDLLVASQNDLLVASQNDLLVTTLQASISGTFPLHSAITGCATQVALHITEQSVH